mmetsp:Transcript_7941/g.23664  ORF Transcript_7941/g.23664 Transcript_7941/m.23664 type:complete len:409 (+) Transcript_7941:1356-2582(+)
MPRRHEGGARRQHRGRDRDARGLGRARRGPGPRPLRQARIPGHVPLPPRRLGGPGLLGHAQGPHPHGGRPAHAGHVHAHRGRGLPSGQARGHVRGPHRHVRAPRLRGRVRLRPRDGGQHAPRLLPGLPRRGRRGPVRQDDAGDVRDRGHQVPRLPQGRARHGPQRQRVRRDGVGRAGVRAHVAPQGPLRPRLHPQPGRPPEPRPPRAQEEPQAVAARARPRGRVHRVRLLRVQLPVAGRRADAPPAHHDVARDQPPVAPRPRRRAGRRREGAAGGHARGVRVRGPGHVRGGRHVPGEVPRQDQHGRAREDHPRGEAAHGVAGREPRGHGRGGQLQVLRPGGAAPAERGRRGPLHPRHQHRGADRDRHAQNGRLARAPVEPLPAGRRQAAAGAAGGARARRGGLARLGL